MTRTRILARLVPLVLLAPALASAESAHARNVDLFWSLVGDADPSTPAAFADGRTMHLAQALDEAAARAGAVDLAALSSGAVSPTPLPTSAPAGDVWALEVGDGPCTSVITPIHWPFAYVGDPQLWLYIGNVGQMSTAQGDFTLIVGWTVKATVVGHDTPGFTATGITDFFCFDYAGMHFAFPFIDGEAHLNPDP